MQAASDILQHKRQRLIDSAPAESQAGLRILLQAVTGRAGSQQGSAEPAQRLEWLQRALRSFEPAMRSVHARDPEWWRPFIADPVKRLRADLQTGEARRRVDDAMLIDDENAIELPREELNDETAEAYGQTLVPGIDRLVSALTMLGDKIQSLESKEFERAFREIAKDWDLGRLRFERLTQSKIIEIQSTLLLLRGYLTIPDAWEKAKQAEDRIGKIDSYAQLVENTVGFVGSCASLTATVGASVAKAAGHARLGRQLLEFSASSALKLGKVLSVIELVYGACKILAGESFYDRLDGAMHMGIGGASLGLVSQATKGRVLAGPLSVALAVGYVEWQALMAAHGQFQVSKAVGRLQPAFELLVDSAGRIREASIHLTKAGLLLEREEDPAKQEALGRVVEEATHTLTRIVDTFLDSCTPRAGVGSAPGTEFHLWGAFASLLALRGDVASPEEALRKAHLVITKIGEVLDDAPDHVRLSMGLTRSSSEETEP
jgi:hypothetical protein